VTYFRQEVTSQKRGSAITVALAVDRRRVLPPMIPLMLVLFISNLDATVVATAIPSIGRSLPDLAGSGPG
jgi:hypothetical protein